MLSFFIATAMLWCVAHIDTVHHFRHHGIITEMLRERLGIAQHNITDGEANSVMLLPELHKVLSKIHERHNIERLARRLNPFNREDDNSDENLPKQSNTEDSKENGDSYQRIMTLALNHLLKNLQTVEGGQEAMNWISSLRTGTPTRLLLNDNKQVEGSSTVRSVPLDDDSENEAIPKQ